jgi:hypothetical protein
MSAIIVSGDTSGTVTLQAPAVSGSTVLTLPLDTATIGLSPLVTTFTGSGTWTPRSASVMVSIFLAGGGGGLGRIEPLHRR